MGALGVSRHHAICVIEVASHRHLERLEINAPPVQRQSLEMRDDGSP